MTSTQGSILFLLLSNFDIFQQETKRKSASPTCLLFLGKEPPKQGGKKTPGFPAHKRTRISLALGTGREGQDGSALAHSHPVNAKLAASWRSGGKHQNLSSDLPMSELAATRTLPPPSIKVLMVSTLMLPPKSERGARLSDPGGSPDTWAEGGQPTSHNR